MGDGSVQTPLVDLLRAIPIDEKLRVEDHKGFSRNFPVGSMAHSAADRIAALETENAALRAKVPTATQSDRGCAIKVHQTEIGPTPPPYKYGDRGGELIAAHVAPIRAQLDEAVADSDAWQTVACFLAGLMIPVGQFDVRRLFQWVRSGKDLATLPTGDAEKGAEDE